MVQQSTTVNLISQLPFNISRKFNIKSKQIQRKMESNSLTMVKLAMIIPTTVKRVLFQVMQH